MIPQGILQMLQQGQQTPQQNPGPLLGGSAMAAPQATGPGAMGAPPAQSAAPGNVLMGLGQPVQQGAPGMPGLNAGTAGAMATGLNLASASMPHPAGMPAQGMGLTGPGVQQALGGGMGAGMSPQMMQLLLRARMGAGNGTA